ncbi:MAG: hypothetical protein H0V40_03335 [Actinobacteria bacterium]|nr:hypothetical protein [Actinomycetota bacterium]
MRACGGCGGSIEGRFRFCPWCAAPLRLKLVEFFRADPRIEGGSGKALRVSRYLAPGEEGHVRFSVWTEGSTGATAESALSLDEAEAERLARYLLAGVRRPPASARLRALIAELRR